MKFSIVCLTYKRLELLEESIYSVLQQTYKDWELLIINDCEMQILQYEHPQIKIFNLNKKFTNIADKRNFGKSKISGEYVMNLDDDDLLLPDYLENLTHILGPEWTMIQRPIIYYNDPTKIHLSPVPQTNTFIYSNKIAKQFNYEIIDNDELNNFYINTEKNFNGSKSYIRLKAEKCGYVWRQDIDELRKYSLAKLFLEKTTEEEQDKIFNNIPYKSGNIVLFPKWNNDYVSIIKSNYTIKSPSTIYNSELLELSKIVKSYTLHEVPKETRENNNAWKSVKPSWENAVKFLNAVKSRGIVSTVLDATGIDKTLGERVSNKILYQRKLSCFGDKARNVSKCDRLKYIETKGYFCGGCGCGDQSLARLDADSPDEYTKLHYPQLECPLKKKGFSNEEVVNVQNINIISNNKLSSKSTFPLSIVIPALNEPINLLQNTIKSIRETSGDNIEIIVIDDCSDIPVVADAKIIRNKIRMGTGLARHLGAKESTNDYILFSDAHMVFENGWYENAMQQINPNNKQIAYCGTCLGLNEQNQTLENHRGAYYGAKLVLYDESRKNLFEGRWIPEIKNQDNYDIACMMGAMYFVPKELYFKVRGFSDLRMWGSLEPCLCTKIWLSGGEVKLLKTVRAGHIFRNKSPYSTKSAYLTYNKIRLAKSFLPNDLGEFLISKLHPDKILMEAKQLIEKDKDEIEEYSKYYQSIFVKDIYWLDKKFGISMPKEFIKT